MSKYQEMDALLGNKSGRKVGNNTYAERVGYDIAIRLHSTDVVTLHPDNTTTIKTDGWYTVTTKDRINKYLDNHVVYQKNRKWYLDDDNTLFADGMTVQD